MSFRQFGGLKQPSKHNVVSGNYKTYNPSISVFTGNNTTNTTTTGNTTFTPINDSIYVEITVETIPTPTQSNNKNYYIPIVSSNSSSNSNKQSSIQVNDSDNNSINVNTSTSTITATNFEGNASTATNINITSNTENETFYPTFVSDSTGNNALYVNTTGLSFNPSTNNFGVGTNNPSCALDVRGDLNVDGFMNGIINNPGLTFLPLDISSNFGREWSPINMNYNWYSVAISASGQYQTAITNDGNINSWIFYSSNYGMSWRPVFQLDYTGYSVTLSASGQYQTVITNNKNGCGSIYYSYDFGNNWNQVSGFINACCSVSMSASGQYQTAVAVNTGIFCSTDYGVTWSQYSTLTYNWSSVALSSSGQYQTATVKAKNDEENYETGIYYSTDYGVTWNISPTTLLHSWNSVVISASGQYQTAVASSCIYGSGIYGSGIYGSTDYGVSWTESIVNVSQSYNWSSVAMSASGQYQTVVAGSCIFGSCIFGSGIFCSTNYGVSWSETIVPISASYTPTSSYKWSSVAMSASGQYQTAVILGGIIYKSVIINSPYYTCQGNTDYVPYNSSSMMWNLTNTINPAVSKGETDFVNHFGDGSGGFHFYSFGLNSKIGVSSPIVEMSTDGAVTASSFNVKTDYPNKENIKSLDEKFVIDNLYPVTFINTKSGKQDIGLIADELQEIYPFLVTGEKDGKESQSINYTGIIGILINEVKDLKRELFQLKNRKIKTH
jgi:photosystem II stability/assembly factor-like uncharacterized protein